MRHLERILKVAVPVGIIFLVVAIGLILTVVHQQRADQNRVCRSQKQTVAAVRDAFQEFKKTVFLSYEQFPPDSVRRTRDAAFFNAVLLVLEKPSC